MSGDACRYGCYGYGCYRPWLLRLRLLRCIQTFPQNLLYRFCIDNIVIRGITRVCMCTYVYVLHKWGNTYSIWIYICGIDSTCTGGIIQVCMCIYVYALHRSGNNLSCMGGKSGDGYRYGNYGYGCGASKLSLQIFYMGLI